MSNCGVSLRCRSNRSLRRFQTQLSVLSKPGQKSAKSIRSVRLSTLQFLQPRYRCRLVPVGYGSPVALLSSLRRPVRRRPRPSSGAVVEPCPPELIRQLGYSSQLGQDLLLYRHVFGGRTKGVVVDFGAHDGVTFSNSFFLERSRGWTAVCIEPNPKVFVELERNRPNATCVECAVEPRLVTPSSLQSLDMERCSAA